MSRNPSSLLLYKDNNAILSGSMIARWSDVGAEGGYTTTLSYNYVSNDAPAIL